MSPTNRSFVDLLTNSSGTASLEGLLPKITAINTGRSSSPLKFCITEINLGYQNSSTSSNNTYAGHTDPSFIAGQWLAETYSIAL